MEQQAPRLQRSLQELLWQEACRHILSFLSTAQSGGHVCRRAEAQRAVSPLQCNSSLPPTSRRQLALCVCVLCVFAAHCWALGRIDERLGTGKGQILKSSSVGEIAG